MAQGIEDKVTLAETDGIKMMALLNKNGYDASRGMHSDYSGHTGSFPIDVGILKGSEPRRLLGIIRVRRDYIGELKFDSKTSCNFKVYGRQYVPELKNLAEEIVKTFGVKVSLTLVHEEPLEEILPHK